MQNNQHRLTARTHANVEKLRVGISGKAVGVCGRGPIGVRGEAPEAEAFLLTEKLKMQNNCMPINAMNYWYKTTATVHTQCKLYVRKLAIRVQDYENVS